MKKLKILNLLFGFFVVVCFVREINGAGPIDLNMILDYTKEFDFDPEAFDVLSDSLLKTFDEFLNVENEDIFTNLEVDDSTSDLLSRVLGYVKFIGGAIRALVYWFVRGIYDLIIGFVWVAWELLQLLKSTYRVLIRIFGF